MSCGRTRICAIEDKRYQNTIRWPSFKKDLPGFVTVILRIPLGGRPNIAFGEAIHALPRRVRLGDNVSHFPYFPSSHLTHTAKTIEPIRPAHQGKPNQSEVHYQGRSVRMPLSIGKLTSSTDKGDELRRTSFFFLASFQLSLHVVTPLFL